MYLPSAFKEERSEVLVDFIKQNPFGLLISEQQSRLEATPLPWVWHPENPSILLAHMAKANDHWKTISPGTTGLIVFQGLSNYISPNWYPSKQEHHQVVPTWNYEMVQVRGRLTLTEDSATLLQLVSLLTHHQETQHRPSWSVVEAPAEFIQRQCQAIIGIEMQVESIVGKMKLSQNRTEADRHGVCQGLEQADSPFTNPKMAQRIRG